MKHGYIDRRGSVIVQDFLLVWVLLLGSRSEGRLTVGEGPYRSYALE